MDRESKEEKKVGNNKKKDCSYLNRKEEEFIADFS